MLKRSLEIVITLVLSLTIAIAAHANAPAPPWSCWLKFEPDVTVESLQISQDRGANDREQIVVRQYGTCNTKGCLKDPISHISNELQLDCHDNLCLLALNNYIRNIDPQKIRITAQIKDRHDLFLTSGKVRSSGIFALGDSKAARRTFDVKVNDRSLDITLRDREEIDRWQLFQERAFWESLLLTLSIELTIWSLYLWRRKAKLVEILLTGASLLVVHAFSFAIVWHVFPSFRPFASNLERAMALTWLLFSSCYGILPFSLKSQHMVRVGGILAGSILYWFIAIIITGIIGFFSGYGYSFPSASGLPIPLLTIASELFVVVYEAWIVQKMRSDILAFKPALTVSFVANAASCLAGLGFFLIS